MGDFTITIDDATFDETISSPLPTLVDYWAEWCGPCRMIAPVLEEIAETHAGRLQVAKLNVDENPDVARTSDVMSLPTLVIFKDGVEKKRIVGARPKAHILGELAEFLG